jgi:hypothetical protein
VILGSWFARIQAQANRQDRRDAFAIEIYEKNGAQAPAEIQAACRSAQTAAQSEKTGLWQNPNPPAFTSQQLAAAHYGQPLTID